MTAKGVVYIATGQKYLKEAEESCRRLKHSNPELSVTLFTNTPSLVSSNLFQHIHTINDPFFSYRDKIAYIAKSPYSLTLFLDTDAAPISNISHIFKVLDYYDIAGVKAPVSIPSNYSDQSLPSFFPEINTGVILFRNSPLIREFFSSWLHSYDRILSEQLITWDQASFRSELWQFISSNILTYFNLPCEYNFRLTKPWIASKGSKVYIVHGRVKNDEWDLLAKYLNTDISCFRTYANWYSTYPGSNIKLKGRLLS